MSFGDIGAVIDTLEFDTVQASHPAFCHISGDIFCGTYLDGDGHLHIFTFSVDSSGNISNSVIDHYENADTAFSTTSIIKSVPGHVLFAGQRAGGNSSIYSIPVDDDGNITPSVVGSADMDTSGAEQPSSLLVGSLYAAFVYNRGATHCFVRTFGLSADGTMDSDPTDTLELANHQTLWPRICQVKDHIYAAAFFKPYTEGHLKTFSISASGLMPASPIDAVNFESVTCDELDLCLARSGFVSVAYSGVDSHLQLVSAEIDSGGDIKTPLADTYELATEVTDSPRIIPMLRGYLAVVFQGPGAIGEISTVLMDSLGSFNSTTLGNATFEASRCYHPKIIRVSGNIYAMVFDGVDSDGFAESIAIETPSTGFPQHLLLMGIG